MRLVDRFRRVEVPDEMATPSTDAPEHCCRPESSLCQSITARPSNLDFGVIISGKKIAEVARGQLGFNIPTNVNFILG